MLTLTQREALPLALDASVLSTAAPGPRQPHALGSVSRGAPPAQSLCQMGAGGPAHRLGGRGQVLSRRVNQVVWAFKLLHPRSLISELEQLPRRAEGLPCSRPGWRVCPCVWPALPARGPGFQTSPHECWWGTLSFCFRALSRHPVSCGLVCVCVCVLRGHGLAFLSLRKPVLLQLSKKSLKQSY